MRCQPVFLAVVLLIRCTLSLEAPSNLVIVGGFPKCGTSHIHRVLEAHPNVASLAKQIGALPNLQKEFEEAVFVLAEALRVPSGFPLAQACDQFDQMSTFKECGRLASMIRGWYNTSMPATLVVTDIFFFEKEMLASRWPGKVKLLFVVREPADFLWAAYNFWVLAGEPKSIQDDWTEKGKHVRSPEHFDELVLADGKNFAWAPRANKITGRWFDQIKSVNNVTTNLLFLKSEDFTDDLEGILAKMGSFFGVQASLFPTKVAHSHTNSQAVLRERGSHQFTSKDVQPGLYQISGWRPMLCGTRRFIYSRTRDVCEQLDSFGVHYGACLGEHDDCVDPLPGARATPPPWMKRYGSFTGLGSFGASSIGKRRSAAAASFARKPLTTTMSTSTSSEEPPSTSDAPANVESAVQMPSSTLLGSADVMAIPVFVLGLTCGLVISRLVRSH
ncbi:unnamed protein product [Symbiodinium sp. CCMP2592]|nr:unnamed protein product [Symbiodinium sp. CCMP2592]